MIFAGVKLFGLFAQICHATGGPVHAVGNAVAHVAGETVGLVQEIHCGL